MGTLTQDMTRLCSEITGLHESREALVKDLAAATQDAKNQVSAMRKGFRKAHSDMAARMRADQAKFVSTLEANVFGMLKGFDKAHQDMATKTRRARLKFVTENASDVFGLLNGFRKNHAAMARNSKSERNRFVSDLNKTVTAMRQETASDLEGARQVWRGLSSGTGKAKKDAERKAQIAAAEKARADAALRAKAEADRKAAEEAERLKQEQAKMKAKTK